MGETVPEVLSTASGGTQTEGTVSLSTDRPRQVNNIFIFFMLRFKSFRKTSASNLCVLKKGAFVLMLIQSARSIANQNKT